MDGAAAIEAARENGRHLPGVPLPSEVEVTADEGRVAAARELVVMAVPSAHMRAEAVRISSMIRPDTVLLSVAKGIERGSLLRMSEVLAAEVPIDPMRICALSGPNLAGEIAAGPAGKRGHRRVRRRGRCPCRGPHGWAGIPAVPQS